MKSKLAICSFVLSLVFFACFFIGTGAEIRLLIIAAYIIGPLGFVLLIISWILIKLEGMEGVGFVISTLILFLLWFSYVMFGLLKLY
jgi:hypothetical protein